MTRRFWSLAICLMMSAICVVHGYELLGAEGRAAAGSDAASVAVQDPTLASSKPVARSCFVTPRLFAGTNGKAADLNNKSALPASSESLARSLGLEFVKGSTTTLLIERDGKKYEVNLVTRAIREIDPPAGKSLSAQAQAPSRSAFAGKQPSGAAIFAQNCSMCHGRDGKGLAALKTPDFTDPRVQSSISDAEMLRIIQNGKQGTMMPAFGAKLSAEQIAAVQSFLRSLNPEHPSGGAAAQAGAESKPKVYEAGDDVVFTLPTGRRLERHGLYVNFAHRFPFDPAFSGVARGGALLGLDGVALPSFGFRFGVTSRLTVGIYREPSLMGRPIQLSTGYNLLDEHDGAPLNLAVRFAIQGQNDFLKNYTESIEGIVSRSLGSRAQLYLVPTLSFNNRPLQLVGGFESSDIPNLPGHNTFSLGVGGALDIRPTVALVAEVIPTLANGRPMGILRPAYSFGIQKKIWRHAFTFGFTTAPGLTVADRAGTRASFLGQPNADTPSGLFIGFDLTRQLF